MFQGLGQNKRLFFPNHHAKAVSPAAFSERSFILQNN